MWKYSKANIIIIVFSILGGTILCILCCRLTDIKVVTAYSSVVHISLVMYSYKDIIWDKEILKRMGKLCPKWTG